MKIGIYNEPCGGAIGGSEVSVAVLAEALADEHEVEILHRYPDLTHDVLADYAGVNLSRVQLRRLPRVAAASARSGNLWSRHRADIAEGARLTAGYDVFIAFAHRLPPFCAARAGVLMVLFPLADAVTPTHMPKGVSFAYHPLFKGLHRAWMRKKLRSRLQGYPLVLANSEFTRRWTQRRWHTDAAVLYPPVDVGVQPGLKENCILSVGRFSGTGTGKKQLEMLQAFARLRAAGFTEWNYHSVGSSGSSSADVDFLERARHAAAASGATVAPDLERTALLQLYRQAKIFWHATGMDLDETIHPEKMEHFGMVTVEAMAAGCVPVVINRGGQSEIVQHGINGFLWNTLDEWHRYSSLLMTDDKLRERMSRAAHERAQFFSRRAYVERFRSALAPHLPTPTRHLHPASDRSS